MRRFLLALALILTTAVPAFAWSAKEHILITRLAVRELLASDATPADMKEWLKEAQPNLGTLQDDENFLLYSRVGIFPHGVDGLAFWATMPDLLADTPKGRDAKIKPFNLPEAQLHFVDLEYLNADPARQSFAPDLSHKPALAEIPRDMNDPRWQKAGMLPFRIESLHKALVACLKSGKLLDKPGQFPRDEHAVNIAGQLAHYAEDNWQPMHATIDYQAYSFFSFADKKPKVHFDMEYRLVDDENVDYPELRKQFWQYLTADMAATPRAELKDDVWTASLRNSLTAYDALPLIGRAAQAAYLDSNGALKGFDADAFYGFSDTFNGKKTSILEMKAQMMANAAKWVEALWIDAWAAAHAK